LEWPPPYQLEVNPRLRHLRLRLDHRGLVIIVPRGFDRRELARVLEAKRGWLERHHDTVVEQGRRRREEALQLPETIEFLATGQVFSVRYRIEDFAEVRLQQHGQGSLEICGKIEQRALVRQVLSLWLRDQARRRLPPLVLELAQQLGLTVDRIGVRSQLTRWGSCSGRARINLNDRLLFLPPHLVRHVIVHELCHLGERNHSSRFFQRLAEVDPDHLRHRAELRAGKEGIPPWARLDHERG